MSLIIVEGPDGAGKTTLIEKITERMVTRGQKPHVRNHGSYPGEANVFRHYAMDVLDALIPDSAIDVIMDRSWISEPIYGLAMRGGANRIAPYQRKTLEDLAVLAGGVVIVCLPSLDVCREAWRARLDTEYVKREEQYRCVYDGYALALSMRPWPMDTIAYDRTNLDSVFWCLNHTYNPIAEMMQEGVPC